MNENLRLNKNGQIAYAPWDLSMFEFEDNKPELMHLTRAIIQYFDRPWEDMNNQQLNAKEELLRWIAKRLDPGNREDEHDAEQLIPCHEMYQVWQWVHELFLGGCLLDAEFSWTRDIEEVGLAIWQQNGRSQLGTIQMYPDKNTDDFGAYKALAVFSTLVHEAVHIFLERIGCMDCKTAKFHDALGSHGRPFQLLVAKLEEVIPRLLGIPVKLDGYNQFLNS